MTDKSFTHHAPFLWDILHYSSSSSSSSSCESIIIIIIVIISFAVDCIHNIFNFISPKGSKQKNKHNG